MSLKVLITGFEPFGECAENSSWTVAEKIAARGIKGVVVEQLPVSFCRVGAVLSMAIERHNPDVVIMLGQSAITDRVKLERVALNLMDSAKGDNDGYTPNEEPIYDGEDNALFTTLNIKQLYGALHKVSIPAHISNSAGLYVCNRTYYEALRLCKERTMQAIFVHLPLFEGQATTNTETQTMPLADMAKAIHTIITEINDKSREI